MNIHNSMNIEDIRDSNDIRETDYRGYQGKKPHEGDQ